MSKTHWVLALLFIACGCGSAVDFEAPGSHEEGPLGFDGGLQGYEVDPYKLIVTSYSWINDTIVDAIPVSASSVRMPSWAEPAADRFDSQAANKYGRWSVALLNAHNVDFLSGYWHGPTSNSLNNFRSAFGSVDLGRLRLIHMAGLHVIDEPGGRWVLQEEINSWRAEAADRSRYGYMAADRPIIMLWGSNANDQSGEFRPMINAIRDHYGEIGLNPYIIMTQHGAFSGLNNIIMSVDAFYNHGIDKPGVGGVWSTAQAIPGTQQKFDSILDRIQGKTNFATGQPIRFIPGAMPQFDRTLYSINYEGEDSHGVVRLGSLQQARDMFNLVRDYSPTINGKGWGVVSTWNEWYEGTTIEPTAAIGARYPGGNYQYDLLDAVSEVFGH